LVVDIVLSDEKNVPDTYRNFLDLNTLIQTEGGMERAESEFRELLATVGSTSVGSYPPMLRSG
jgi:hypothetical protein